MIKPIVIVLGVLSLIAMSFWLGGHLQANETDNELVSLLKQDYCQKVEVEGSQLPRRKDLLMNKIDQLRDKTADCANVAYGGVRDHLYLISSHIYGVEMLSRALQTASIDTQNPMPAFEMVAFGIDEALVSDLEQKCRYGSKDVERWDVLVNKSLIRVEEALKQAGKDCREHGYIPLKERQMSNR